jgi:hypothetical protein
MAVAAAAAAAGPYPTELQLGPGACSLAGGGGGGFQLIAPELIGGEGALPKIPLGPGGAFAGALAADRQYSPEGLAYVARGEVPIGPRAVEEEAPPVLSWLVGPVLVLCALATGGSPEAGRLSALGVLLVGIPALGAASAANGLISTIPGS